MWRFIFYIVPSYEKLEEKLFRMEKKGYYCDLVVLNYFFHFSSKNNNHVAKYYMINYMLEKRIIDIEYYIRDLFNVLNRRYNSKLVKKRFTKADLYRTIKTVDEDFIKRFINARNEYYIHVMKVELPASVILAAYSSFLLWHYKGDLSTLSIVLFTMICLVALFFTVWNSIHLVRLTQKREPIDWDE